MASRRDLDDPGLVHLRPAVVVLGRHLGKGAQRVQLCDQRCRQLHPRHLSRRLCPQRGEQVVFQRRVPVMGGEHLVLQILQLLGDIALAVHQRLLAYVVRRHLVLKGVAHLDIVSEHLVVPHLQGTDAGLLLLPGLQLRDEPLAAGEYPPQPVHLIVIALADHAALPDGERRLVYQHGGNAPADVLQRLQLLVQLSQCPCPERRQAPLDLRQVLQRRPQVHQVPGSGGAVDDPAHQPFHVAHAGQGQPQLLAAHGVVRQRRHGIQPPVDGRHVHQRLLQPHPQVPRAHGCLGLIQHPQQAALLLLAPQRLRQLQIAPGRQVQLHELSRPVPLQLIQLLHIGLLRLVEIRQQSAQRQQRCALIPGQVPQRRLAELQPHLLLRVRHVEPPLRQPLPPAGKALLQRGGQCRVVIGRGVHHHFRRGEAPQLVDQPRQPLRPGERRHLGLSGGDVRRAQSRRRVCQIHAAQIVAASRVQAGLVQHRTGGDGADDLPLHQPLGQGRVLHLLTDGHLVPLGDQPRDIPLGGVIRHAAHRDALLVGLALVLVPGGQGQVQLLRRRPGVRPEHLVKITQPEKQQGVGVLLLLLHILPHHGCQLSHSSAPFSLWEVCALRRGALSPKSPAGPECRRWCTAGT